MPAEPPERPLEQRFAKQDRRTLQLAETPIGRDRRAIEECLHRAQAELRALTVNLVPVDPEHGGVWTLSEEYERHALEVLEQHHDPTRLRPE